MSTTIGTETAAITTTERTTNVERQTPRTGLKDYRLLVHREVVRALSDGTVLGVDPRPDAVNLLVSQVLTLDCTAAYLAACQRATSLMDLLEAEVAWYDALVAWARANPPAEA